MRTTESLLLCSVLLLCGCFQYTPVELENVPEGSSIRAHLSAEGAEALRDLPAARERSLEGEFDGVDGDMLRLTVSTSASSVSYGAGDLSQSVTIARDDLVALELKQLDRVKTAGLVAVAAAGLAALAVELFGGETRLAERDPPPNGPVEIRVPVGLWLHR